MLKAILNHALLVVFAYFGIWLGVFVVKALASENSNA
jgi:hypothetical protein